MPLEAGLGPENPPCPACGEPLFGWATAPVEPPAPVRRCESCGLGVAGEPGDPEHALRELDRLRVPGGGSPRLRIANRSSLQAWIGGKGWALLEPDTRYLFTPEAVRRLVALRDQEVERARWLAGASLLGMCGTLANGFTFGRNILIGALGGAAATPAAARWQRAIDRFVSVVVSLPVLIVTVPLEAGGALTGRGGVLELALKPL
ncbi:MAG: hypothetical protein AABM29_00460 [Actinomycetota bacterium]